MEVKLTRDNFQKYQEKCKQQRKRYPIRLAVANGTCAQAAGSKKIIQAFKEQLAEHQLKSTVLLTEIACLGLCSSEPNALVKLERNKPAIFYANLKPKNIKRIVTETIIKKKILKDLLFQDPVTSRRHNHREDMTFFNRQKKVLLKHY